jgi:hypothetical protein
VFSSFVVVIAGLTGNDQVRRWRTAMRKSVGVALFEAGHGEVARAAEAGAAWTIGADPQGRQPETGTRMPNGIAARAPAMRDQIATRAAC